MKIFSIVVFKGDNSVSLVATAPTNQIRENVLKTTIFNTTIDQCKNNSSFRYDTPIKLFGGGDKSTVYYSIIFKDKKVVAFATDAEIEKEKLDILVYAMKSAQTLQQLQKILTDPQKFSKSKIETIQAEVDDTKQVMLSNIDKVLERGDKIDALIDRTESLGDRSMRFNKKASRFAGSMFCRERFCCCLPGSNEERNNYVPMTKGQRRR